MTPRTAALEPAPGPFHAEVTVPGDKSLSHRALVLGAMATGRSEVTNLGPGADVAATIGVLRSLGVDIDGGIIESAGVGHWEDPGATLHCANSGTTLRLLAGALAAQPYRAVLDGDASLRVRPMDRLVDPLRALGAQIGVSARGTAPVTTGGITTLHGRQVQVPIASAQVRSAFELAALQAQGDSVIDSPGGFRDHTERWLESLALGERETTTRFRVHPHPVPPTHFALPGDPSSAAFLWASAAIIRGSSVTTPNVSLNPGRLGFLQTLESMGARLDAEVTGEVHGDPVGTVTVHGAALVATNVGGELATAALDELPLVAVVAAYAEGVTTVGDAGELRGKETDRIAATVDLIRALGGGAEEKSEGFAVLGTGFLDGGAVQSHGDHRIAMAAAVAATAATGTVHIEGAEAAAVSWPGFYEVLERVWSSP